MLQKPQYIKCHPKNIFPLFTPMSVSKFFTIAQFNFVGESVIILIS